MKELDMDPILKLAKLKRENPEEYKEILKSVSEVLIDIREMLETLERKGRSTVGSSYEGKKNPAYEFDPVTGHPRG